MWHQRFSSRNLMEKKSTYGVLESLFICCSAESCLLTMKTIGKLLDKQFRMPQPSTSLLGTKSLRKERTYAKVIFKG